MGYLLNVAYLALIAAALPWLLYQRLRHGKYRDGWREKFLGLLPPRSGEAPCIWFHAVSVGEVNLLVPLVERWQRLHPAWAIAISTTTQTGFQLAKKRYPQHTVVYCPLDFTWAVRRAMRALRPDLLVLSELELWPNLIAAAKEHGAKVAVINGRLSEKSFRGYRRVRWLLSRLLPQIDAIAVQNEEYAARFLALGATPSAVIVTGSVKFDGARTERSAPETQRLARLAGIQPQDIVFLAGSTQESEESLALDVFQRLADEFQGLKLILVPRHPERFGDVAALLNQRGLSWQRRSELPGLGSGARVLLVDAVGELGHWWGTAQIAFVGGSLTRRGGQNMIEPAGYGAAISFGPNTWNFRDVVALLLAGDAAVVVHNGQDLQQFVGRCLVEPAYAEGLGQRAAKLVRQQQGATAETMRLLRSLIDLPAAELLRRTDAPQSPGGARTTSHAIRRRAV